MTAQFHDEFIYDGQEHYLVGYSNGEPFHPSHLNLEVKGTCSACWRGYLVRYSVMDNRLCIQTLRINFANEELVKRYDDEGVPWYAGPPIGGKRPTGSGGLIFNNYYENLNYTLEYTGNLLIGWGFISDLYVHMGFHKPWKFRKVLELEFDHGHLTKVTDRSEAMASVRERRVAELENDSDNTQPTSNDIKEWIQRAFDQSYQSGASRTNLREWGEGEERPKPYSEQEDEYLCDENGVVMLDSHNRPMPYSYFVNEPGEDEYLAWYRSMSDREFIENFLARGHRLPEDFLTKNGYRRNKDGKWEHDGEE